MPGERFGNSEEYVWSVSVISVPLNSGSVMKVLTSSSVMLYINV